MNNKKLYTLMCVVLILFMVGVYVFYTDDDEKSGNGIKKDTNTAVFNFNFGDSSDEENTNITNASETVYHDVIGDVNTANIDKNSEDNDDTSE